MIRCRHHACQCARAAELADMGKLPEALQVHQDDKEVMCRRRKKVKEGVYTFGGILGMRALGYPAALAAERDHPFQGDGPDCTACGEGRRHYLHLMPCEDCDGRGCTLCGHTGEIER